MNILYEKWLEDKHLKYIVTSYSPVFLWLFIYVEITQIMMMALWRTKWNSIKAIFIHYIECAIVFPVKEIT